MVAGGMGRGEEAEEGGNIHIPIADSLYYTA